MPTSADPSIPPPPSTNPVTVLPLVDIPRQGIEAGVATALGLAAGVA